MAQPFPVPVGLRLNQATRVVERAFDEALAEADGTLPVWLILLNLTVKKPASQRELAEAVGVREATLTHHLNAMDARGLITRTRDAANRRVQVVALTEAGRKAFTGLREVAMSFDARLRAGLTDADLATLGTLLGRLAANAGAGDPGPGGCGSGGGSGPGGAAAAGGSGPPGPGWPSGRLPIRDLAG